MMSSSSSSWEVVDVVEDAGDYAPSNRSLHAAAQHHEVEI